MPVRINSQTAALVKPKVVSGATRYVGGSQQHIVPKQKQAVLDPNQTKKERKAIRQVFDKSKSGHVAKGEGVSGLIMKMLLENKWTNDEIVKAVERKHGIEAGEIWRNRIAIFRSDINAGRRMVKQVAELRVHLPLIRLQRVGGKLIAAEGRDTRSKKTGLPGNQKKAPAAPAKAPVRSPVKKAVVPPPRKVPVRK